MPDRSVTSMWPIFSVSRMTDTRRVHLVAREVLHAATYKFVTGRGDRFLTLFNSGGQIRELIRKSDKVSDKDKGTGDKREAHCFCRAPAWCI